MRFDESYEQHRNRMATDIVACPECDNENLFLTDSISDKENREMIDQWRCEDCKHEFESRY